MSRTPLFEHVLQRVGSDSLFASGMFPCAGWLLAAVIAALSSSKYYGTAFCIWVLWGILTAVANMRSSVAAEPRKHQYHRVPSSLASDSAELSPPPSPPSLQVLVMVRILNEVLAGNDEAARHEMILLIEKETGMILRNQAQEDAVHRLARLADVKAWQGFAEEAALAADPWVNASFMELRQLGRVHLSELELAEYLCDGYENASVSDEDGFECIYMPPGGDHGWPTGHVCIFYTSSAPFPGIEEVLDALQVQTERADYKGRPAILGFLSTCPFVALSPPQASASEGNGAHAQPTEGVRSWDNRPEPFWQSTQVRSRTQQQDEV